MEDDVPVLSQAVRDGSVEIVEELLKHGAQVNEKVLCLISQFYT